MEIREELYSRSASTAHGLEHVLASYVRRRRLSIKDIQNEWGLTDGEARGVLYAQASRNTLNTVLKAGGWPVGLMLVAGVVGHTLATHIEKRIAHERNQYERMVGGLRQMAADLPAVFGRSDNGPH